MDASVFAEYLLPGRDRDLVAPLFDRRLDVAYWLPDHGILEVASALRKRYLADPTFTLEDLRTGADDLLALGPITVSTAALVRRTRLRRRIDPRIRAGGGYRPVRAAAGPGRSGPARLYAEPGQGDAGGTAAAGLSGPPLPTLEGATSLATVSGLLLWERIHPRSLDLVVA